MTLEQKREAARAWLETRLGTIEDRKYIQQARERHMRSRLCQTEHGNERHPPAGALSARSGMRTCRWLSA